MFNRQLRPVHCLVRALAISGLAVVTSANAADDTRQLEELRNTVINLLQGLVQKGVLTQEQAQAMVKDAQDKAAAQVAAAAQSQAAQAAAEKDAVRVTYVPEPVRQQIRDELRDEVKTDVEQSVIETAKKE